MTRSYGKPDLQWFGADYVRRDHLRLLDELSGDHRIIGITCWSVFPMIGDHLANVAGERPVEGRHEDYLSAIEGWAHCFRDPENYLPADRPSFLFSNSDNMGP